MLTVYLLGVVILGAFCAYRLGQADVRTRDEVASIFLVVTLLWPFVLIFALLAGPFIGMYYLGDRSKRKRIEEEKNRKVNK